MQKTKTAKAPAPLQKQAPGETEAHIPSQVIPFSMVKQSQEAFETHTSKPARNLKLNVAFSISIL